jgi:hypothetical protein
MTTILTILICIFNIVMWIIFASKFKKIFSTDDIIEKTRDELNHMIIDVNKNADRNITLIEDRIRELKLVTAEADRHLAIAKSEIEKEQKAKQIESKIESKTHPRSAKSINPDTLLVTPTQKYVREQKQGDLFVLNDKSSDVEAATKTKVKPQNESGVVKEIPIITPQVYLSDTPIEPKKDFKTRVKELYSKGKDAEQISEELGRSVQEVKFALEFSI